MTGEWIIKPVLNPSATISSLRFSFDIHVLEMMMMMMKINDTELMRHLKHTSCFFKDLLTYLFYVYVCLSV